MSKQPTKKEKGRKISIVLSFQTNMMADRLMSALGGGLTNLLENLIREAHRKEFPKYTDRLPSPEERNMTNEEYCVQVLGGEVTKGSQGLLVCRIPEGAMTRDIPIGRVKEKK